MHAGTCTRYLGCRSCLITSDMWFCPADTVGTPTRSHPRRGSVSRLALHLVILLSARRRIGDKPWLGLAAIEACAALCAAQRKARCGVGKPAWVVRLRGSGWKKCLWAFLTMGLLWVSGWRLRKSEEGMALMLWGPREDCELQWMRSVRWCRQDDSRDARWPNGLVALSNVGRVQPGPAHLCMLQDTVHAARYRTYGFEERCALYTDASLSPSQAVDGVLGVTLRQAYVHASLPCIRFTALQCVSTMPYYVCSRLWATQDVRVGSQMLLTHRDGRRGIPCSRKCKPASQLQHTLRVGQRFTTSALLRGWFLGVRTICTVGPYHRKISAAPEKPGAYFPNNANYCLLPK